MNEESVTRRLVVGFEPQARMPGGIARYTRELFLALEARTPNDVSLGLTHVGERRRPIAARAWASGVRAGFGAELDAGRAPLATFHATSLFAPPRGAHPLVVTVHDTVAFTHPETLTAHGARWHQRMTERAVRYADAVFVPTAAVATQLLGAFASVAEPPHATGLSLAQRIHVGGGAASLERIPDDEATQLRAAVGVRSCPYVVFLGTIEPRKGLDLLVTAIAQRDDLDLVVVGASGWGGVDVRHLAESAHLDPARLTVTGAVHDTVVAAIIQGAESLVLPSRAEGFGLPVIEAMQLGTPVVHSDDPALVEVAGGAGVVAEILEFDAAHQHDAALVLRDAIDDALSRRGSLSHLGLQRAEAYTWAATAGRVARVHAELAMKL